MKENDYVKFKVSLRGGPQREAQHATPHGVL